MTRIIVSDVMTREPVTIGPDASLLECARKMVRKRVGSLLIKSNKKLVGFISQRDILWALIKKSEKSLSEIKAIEISPKKIATIKPSATIQEALQKMKRLKFERLPVIHNNELVGIITSRDIFNFHPEYYPELDEIEKIREEENKLKRIKKAEFRKEGICEECGNNEILFEIDGRAICESCRNSM